MAEGFARAYGADVLIPASAGLAPASYVAPDSKRAMVEKNIDIQDHFPKSLRQLDRACFDLAINMSGTKLSPETAEQIMDWEIPDPVRATYERHCEIRDQIERRVMDLVMELRRSQSAEV